MLINIFRFNETTGKCELGILDIDTARNDVYPPGDVSTYVKLRFSEDQCYLKLEKWSMAGRVI